MEWLADPTVWLGLATLTLLEIVLGIDNLVFIAILAGRLPPDRRNVARQLGLALALVVRLLLLAAVFWLTTLTMPLLTLSGHGFSGRDLILTGGGLFLLLKATVEIHDRLEIESREQHGAVTGARFGPVVAQIVVLDAVFSVDSILTAVGMTDRLEVMMAAVVIAIGLMVLASEPLAELVSAHPPLVVLCLGFLLIIGLSLISDGVGFEIPKGYLYTAIGFSVLIEGFNQIASRNRKRLMARVPRRQRVAEAVVRLLGGLPASGANMVDGFVESLIADGSNEDVFVPVEKKMISGVFHLAGRPIGSVMTPRPDVAWVDLDDPQDKILTSITNSSHAQLLVGRGSIDKIVGIVRKQDLIESLIKGKPLDVSPMMRTPAVVYEATSILKTLELFKSTPVHMAVVVDEYGTLQGLVTQTDLLEAITGELPDPTGHDEPQVIKHDDGSFVFDAAISIDEAREMLGLQNVPAGDYHTLAGLALLRTGEIPKVGDRFDFEGWRFEIAKMEGARISRLSATRLATSDRNKAAERSPRD